jgi:hypothetical protein
LNIKIRNVTIVILLIVIVLLIGGIYHAGRTTPVLVPLSPTASTTTTTTTTIVAPTNPAVFVGGTYHNSVYGLTLSLPANYEPFDTGSSPTGVVASDSIQFTENGADIFSINVFTKQQWNIIRTKENTEHLNVNDLGEGTYLGENETYIFSYNASSNNAEVQNILSSIKYY